MKDLVEKDDHEIFDKFPELLGLLNDGDREYDFENCVTRSHPDQPYELIDVAAAIIVSGGNVSQCGRLLGRSRRSVHGFILRNHLMSDLLDDVEAIQLDAIEAKARGLAMAGDGSLIKFLLGTKGKDRGYIPRVENTGKNGADLNPVVTYQLPDNGRDTKIEAKDNVVSITQMQREGDKNEDE